MLWHRRNTHPLVFVVLSVLYLILEINFNSQIVGISGALSVTADKIKSVEFFGRCISGVGVSLLVTGLILNWLKSQKIWTLLLTLSLTTLVIWPLVFFGQKWAIDVFFVEPSSPVIRQQAYLSDKFRSALAYNADKIDGIAISPPDELDKFDITFLSIFGVLALSEKSFFNNLEQDIDKTVRNYMTIRAAREFNEHYNDYIKVRSEVREMYREYVSLNKKYDDQLLSYQNISATERFKQVEQLDLWWDTVSSTMEIPFRPGLSWESFQWNPKVQQKIFDALDPTIYTRTIMSDWNSLQFYENVMVPSIYRKEQLAMQTLNLPESAYRDGEYLEEASKESLRSIIVQPISMGISLFLILITIVRIPLRLYELKRSPDVSIDKNTSDNPPKLKSKVVSTKIFLLFTMLVFCLPFTLEKGRFLSSDSASAKLLQSAEKEYGWPVGMGLKWMLITEPIIQPVGQVMESTFEASILFVPYIKMFEDWDWYVLGDSFEYEIE